MDQMSATAVSKVVPRAGRAPISIFAAALLLASTLGFALASLTYGTNDIATFRSFAVKDSDAGVAALYAEGAQLLEFHPEVTGVMNHPPAMIYVLRAILWIEYKTGVPFHVWFRILTLLAHLATAIALYRIAGAWPATVFVLCPAALLIAGFHGNSDPLVVAFLIWAVYAAERDWQTESVGMLFAAACAVKVWPLMLVPAFCLHLKTWRDRLTFILTGAAAWLLFGAPYTFQFPVLIAAKVFGYRSLGGWWGFSPLIPGYDRFGTPLAFAAVALVTFYLHRRGWSLYRVVAGAIATFLVFSPGFGVQYLAWMLPFCFALGWPFVGGFYAASTLLLFAAYNHWSGGLPWYFADSIRPDWLSGGIFYSAKLTWAVLAIAIIVLPAWRFLGKQFPVIAGKASTRALNPTD